MKNGKKTPVKGSLPAYLLLFGIMFFFACSFDYGEAAQDNENQPDIVMKDVEYVRMRDGYPVVRFSAEEAQRFEKKQAMELEQFKFEQFETHAETVSATGNAGLASIELDSGNIHMKGGVRIEVESEDLAIATTTLEWQDKERQLSTGEAERVDITRSDGTSFTGWGFSADARRRSWEFKNGVEGTFVEKDEDEDEDEDEEVEGSTGTDENGDAEGRQVSDGDKDIGVPAAAEKAGTKTDALRTPPVQTAPDKPAAGRDTGVPAAAERTGTKTDAPRTPPAQTAPDRPAAGRDTGVPAVAEKAGTGTDAPRTPPAQPSPAKTEKTEEEYLGNLSTILEGIK
ncbi:MAG: LPS export ABC transporter periplasmic protein LptC [Spirochaetaceae bacterium]|jgi:LPS export ABC transporter protein LptC|nr:LPS export ABC transporter periplasmic protein LptC [Spirochaetaceae bacterium]